MYLYSIITSSYYHIITLTTNQSLLYEQDPNPLSMGSRFLVFGTACKKNTDEAAPKKRKKINRRSMPQLIMYRR